MLSKVIVTWNNYVEVVYTNRPFRTTEYGSSKTAWIDDLNNPLCYLSPHPYTSLEVVRLDVDTKH